jgi:hypothetical protein
VKRRGRRQREGNSAPRFPYVLRLKPRLPKLYRRAVTIPQPVNDYRLKAGRMDCDKCRLKNGGVFASVPSLARSGSCQSGFRPRREAFVIARTVKDKGETCSKLTASKAVGLD